MSSLFKIFSLFYFCTEICPLQFLDVTAIKLLTSEVVVFVTYNHVKYLLTIHFAVFAVKSSHRLVCVRSLRHQEPAVQNISVCCYWFTLPLRSGTNVTLKRGVQLKTGMSWIATQVWAPWEEICPLQLFSWLLTVSVLQIMWRWMTRLIRKVNKNCQLQQDSCIIYSFNATCFGSTWSLHQANKAIQQLFHNIILSHRCMCLRIQLRICHKIIEL